MWTKPQPQDPGVPKGRARRGEECSSGKDVRCVGVCVRDI